MGLAFDMGIDSVATNHCVSDLEKLLAAYEPGSSRHSSYLAIYVQRIMDAGVIILNVDDPVCGWKVYFSTMVGPDDRTDSFCQLVLQYVVANLSTYTVNSLVDIFEFAWELGYGQTMGYIIDTVVHDHWFSGWALITSVSKFLQTPKQQDAVHVLKHVVDTMVDQLDDP
ncbi:hypothetical protein HK102_013741 [Quaeritorhiza haematococci]|nr:hypothetical protein HK102_013741 [Quaeritorhiza haematococci]